MPKKSGRGNARPADLASIPDDDPSEFTMPVAVAAKVLGVSRPQVYRLADTDKLKAIREGYGTKKRYWFRPADVEALKAESRTVQISGTMRAKVGLAAAIESLQTPVDEATNPMIDEVRESNPKLFRHFTDADWAELRSVHGSGGALTVEGVVAEANRINSARKVREKFEAVMHSDYSTEMANYVDFLFEKARFKPKA